MTRQEILRMARNLGLNQHPDQIEALARQILNKSKPLTKTQEVYLEHLSEPRSLKDLAQHFGCTPEGARKHLKVLGSRKLVTRELRYKWGNGRGAWAWQYQAKEKS